MVLVNCFDEISTPAILPDDRRCQQDLVARLIAVGNRRIGRTKGGMNSKLHVVTDAKGRPIRMFLSAGQTSDYIGARVLLSSIPQAGALLADRS